MNFIYNRNKKINRPAKPDRNADLKEAGNRTIELLIDLTCQLDKASGKNIKSKEAITKLIHSRIDEQLSFIENLGIVVKTLEHCNDNKI